MFIIEGMEHSKLLDHLDRGRSNWSWKGSPEVFDTTRGILRAINEPRPKKTCPRGYRLGPKQTGLYSIIECLFRVLKFRI